MSLLRRLNNVRLNSRKGRWLFGFQNEDECANVLLPFLFISLPQQMTLGASGASIAGEKVLFRWVHFVSYSLTCAISLEMQEKKIEQEKEEL